MHLVHQRDVAQAVALALAGALDQSIVNVADDAPMTAYQIAETVGAPMPASSEALHNPWAGHLDSSVARRAGFRPAVPSLRQAVDAGLL